MPPRNQPRVAIAYERQCSPTSEEITRCSRSLLSLAAGRGRNTALAIAQHGGGATLTYRATADEGRSALAGIEAMDRKAIAPRPDVADVSFFKQFAAIARYTRSKSWGRETFDRRVNDVGHGELGRIGGTTEAEVGALSNIHVRGAFFLTQPPPARPVLML